ncbi:hypothetical protein F2Q69_00045511 [Brassica cretica]|uniref:Uncharacterized protein n=1 Tax=Brassica cretica TaxID=69181 RepID=A0A8S9NIA8_BRACR|nr:hypothetical protein F2Q69_00045511 [Brassica cretica]
MACQAEFHVPIPDCLRLVVDILIIAEDKNYLTCIEGFPNTYLMLAESKNPNHELHSGLEVEYRKGLGGD